MSFPDLDQFQQGHHLVFFVQPVLRRRGNSRYRKKYVGVGSYLWDAWCSVKRIKRLFPWSAHTQKCQIMVVPFFALIDDSNRDNNNNKNEYVSKQINKQIKKIKQMWWRKIICT